MPVAWAVSLLDAGEVEEPFGEVVAFGPLAALDLLPCAFAVGKIVAEPEVTRPDRVEHPPRTPLHAWRDQRSPAFASPCHCQSPGLISMSL
jgi:hypothetical protein